MDSLSNKKRRIDLNRKNKKEKEEIKYDIEFKNVALVDEDEKVVLLKDEKINLIIK